MNERNPLLHIPIARAFFYWSLCCSLMFYLADCGQAQNSTNQVADLTSLSLEDLMKLQVPEVYSASKFEQKATEAPSSTTVITSDEIKRYGYRTLADILASVQGFYVTSDRDHAFLGTRGVNLGDFNSRFLLLVNGHRVNDDLNDAAYIDSAFILDVDLIDRVEIIRGPGSVLYGNNAFFGVINVITRQGKQINGAEASGAYGSFDTYSGRVTLGDQFTNGLQYLLSGTFYNSDGQDNLFYSQFNTPLQNNGIAHHMDNDGFGSFFGSVNYQDFTVEGGYIDREKRNPTAQYDTTFNDPRLQTDDDRSYGTLKYDHKFEEGADVLADVYYDRSDSRIGYPEPPGTQAPGSLFYVEQATGEWAGGEIQVNQKIWDKHVITVGGEYRNDFKQEDSVVDPASAGPPVYDRSGHRDNYGLFAQGDFQVVTNFHINAGVRYDQYAHFDSSWSPRVALIYNPFEQSTFKLIYGTAFRDPNFLELSDPRFQNINPEKIASYEIVYEQGIGKYLRSSVSGYYNRMDDLIDFLNSGYTNFNADTFGLEMALEGKWNYDIRTRLSDTLQHTENRDSGSGLPDSPMNLVKFNVSAPVFRDKVFAGLEVQYTSSSHTAYTDLATGDTLPGPDSPGYAVVNFTLFSQNIVKNLDTSVSVYNLFNNEYDEPATRFHLQSVIQQDGITFRLKITYHF
jgi:outer membrane receptor for ferrienterochelin and colicins